MNDPQAFDTGKKGFLTYEEYKGYALSMLKQPLDKKEIGNSVQYEDIRFRKNEVQLDGVFDFLSLGEDRITFDTLRNAVSMLEMDISDEDVMGMISLFNSGDSVSQELFARAFM